MHGKLCTRVRRKSQALHSLGFLLLPGLSVLAGCNGGKTGSFAGSSAEKDASIQETKQQKSASQAPVQSNLGSEDQQAVPPAQVTGAFLTARCEKIKTSTTNLLPSVKKNDGVFGCNILDDKDQVVSGPLRQLEFTIYTYDREQKWESQPVQATLVEWQYVFVVPQMGDPEVRYFSLKGELSGVPLSVFKPFVKPNQEPSCREENDIKKKMFASMMDYTSSLSHLSAGKPSVKIFADTPWESGDRLHLEEATGLSITRTIEQPLVLNPLLNHPCPSGWILTAVDSEGAVRAEYDLGKIRSVTIPDSGVSLTIGYRENALGGYVHNEGGSLAIGVSGSTGGCQFKFVRESRSCLIK